jgi:hypothetical protein
MSTIQNSGKKQNPIKKKLLSLKKRQEKIHQAILALVESCNHLDLNVTNHKRNGSDMNPYYSYSWSVATCPDCGLRLHFADTKTVDEVRVFLEKSNEQDNG